MTLHVECYSGYKGDERPVRFQMNDCDYFVEEVLDQWYGQHEVYFKVCVDSGDLYILRRGLGTTESEWNLEAFRQGESRTSRAAG